jgi:hypothetical protein
MIRGEGDGRRRREVALAQGGRASRRGPIRAQTQRAVPVSEATRQRVLALQHFGIVLLAP